MLRPLLVLLLCLVPLASSAQPRIGVLSFTQLADATRAGLLAGLRAEGYVEGRNVSIEWRSAEGSTGKAKAHAEHFVRSRVDVIVAILTPAVQASVDATKTIPIVMAPSGAPQRFAKTLARPGGNVTGVGGYGADLSGKRIEIIQELVPGIRRIGMLTNKADPFAKSFIAETEAAARQAGLELRYADVRQPEQVAAAYSVLKNEGVGAVIVQGVLTGKDWRAAELALQHRLPAISFVRPWTESGGLAFHAGSSEETYRRAASFVKRILEGAKPAELPVERPTRTELVLNLRTAKALGLQVPQSLLLRADQVIE